MKDLTDICRAINPTTDYTLLLVTHGTLSRIVHMLDHKAHLRKCKIIRIVSHIILDHRTVKLGISEQSNHRSYANT